MIKNITITNFKSFCDKEPIELGRFVVLVGKNASGKSNFIDAFRFLKDVYAIGNLDIAIRSHGGWNSIISLVGPKEAKEITLSLTVQYDIPQTLRSIAKGSPGWSIYRDSHTFSFRRAGPKTRFQETSRILKEMGIRNLTEDGSKWTSFEQDENKIVFSGSDSDSEGGSLTDRIRIQLGDSPVAIILQYFPTIEQGWRFYDINTETPRQPVTADNWRFLTEDGSNLGTILGKLRGRSRTELRERIKNLLAGMTPDFEKWQISKGFDGTVSFRVKETHLKKLLITTQLSDGTIRLMCLLVALLWNTTPDTTIFIEEPERSLHPTVFEQIVQLMRLASEKTQVIVTTHSPEFVRYCQPEEVYMIDKIKGRSVIRRASEIEHIEKFLKNFTLDELWVEGYLDREEEE